MVLLLNNFTVKKKEDFPVNDALIYKESKILTHSLFVKG